jgi:hypothetical protein
MADGAASCSTDLAVSGHMAGDAADDGSLDASLGFRGRDRGERENARRR